MDTLVSQVSQLLEKREYEIPKRYIEALANEIHEDFFERRLESEIIRSARWVKTVKATRRNSDG
jgi:hypothetical protein